MSATGSSHEAKVPTRRRFLKDIQQVLYRYCGGMLAQGLLRLISLARRSASKPELRKAEFELGTWQCITGTLGISAFLLMCAMALGWPNAGERLVLLFVSAILVMIVEILTLTVGVLQDDADNLSS